MLELIGISAFLGGAIRAALGLRKYRLRRGQVAALVSEGIIGAISGIAFISLVTLDGNAALWAAGLAGYVGSDVVESLHKIHMKRGALWV